MEGHKMRATREKPLKEAWGYRHTFGCTLLIESHSTDGTGRSYLLPDGKFERTAE